MSAAVIFPFSLVNTVPFVRSIKYSIECPELQLQRTEFLAHSHFHPPRRNPVVRLFVPDLAIGRIALNLSQFSGLGIRKEMNPFSRRLLIGWMAAQG